MVVQSSGKHTTLAPLPAACRARLSAFSILMFLSMCPLNWASATRTVIGSDPPVGWPGPAFVPPRGALRKGPRGFFWNQLTSRIAPVEAGRVAGSCFHGGARMDMLVRGRHVITDPAVGDPGVLEDG